MKLAIDYEKRHGAIGPDEEAFLDGLGPLEVTGEGHEAVIVRPVGSSHVYKVFRASKEDRYQAGGHPSTEERVGNEVYTGSIGAAPPTEKVQKRILRKPYISTVNSAKLETRLKKGDKKSVHSSLRGLKRYHDKGIVFVDASLTNTLDPEITGGYVTVDGTGTRKARYNDEFLGDLKRITKKAYSNGNPHQAETVVEGVNDVYGSSTGKKLRRIYKSEIIPYKMAA